MAEKETRLLMLVDDEPAQCRLVAAIAGRAGWRTIFARDAETAIAMLGTQDGMMLDAILLDQWVPGSDAATLIAELKSRRPALPVLLMTAIGSTDSAIEAMRAGASDYIIKPVAAERLIAALSLAAEHAIAPRGQPRSRVLRALPGTVVAAGQRNPSRSGPSGRPCAR